MTRRKTGFVVHGVPLFIVTVAATYIIMAICAFAVAAIAYTSENPTAWVRTGGLAASLVTAAICGFGISKWRGDGGFGYSVLSSLSFTLTLLIIKVAANSGALPFGILLDLVCYMGVAVFFAFLGKKRERKRHRRR